MMPIHDEERTFTALLSFLEDLDRSRIAYRLEHIRDSIMIALAVPGERWEIEFFPDGHIEVERFISSGQIEGKEKLNDLVDRYESEAQA